MIDIRPTVIRESCLFREDESAELIEARIAATKERVLNLAALEGVRNPYLSELYAPVSYDDLEAGRGWRKPATNWRDALCECVFGRYARYTAVVRNQDYCDLLDKREQGE